MLCFKTVVLFSAAVACSSSYSGGCEDILSQWLAWERLDNPDGNDNDDARLWQKSEITQCSSPIASWVMHVIDFLPLLCFNVKPSRWPRWMRWRITDNLCRHYIMARIEDARGMFKVTLRVSGVLMHMANRMREKHLQNTHTPLPSSRVRGLAGATDQPVSSP